MVNYDYRSLFRSTRQTSCLQNIQFRSIYTALSFGVQPCLQETQLLSLIIMEREKIGLHDKIHVLKIHGSGKVAYSVATLLRFFVYTVRLMSSSYTHVVLVGLLIKLKFCFTSTETVGLLGTGAQDVHLDFYTAPELCLVCSATDLLYSQSVAWTSRLQDAHLWRSVRVASFF